MKAIVYTKYGSPDVLKLIDVAKPTLGDDEVLIKVHAASINSADLHLLRADPFVVRLACGFLKPKHQILGSDIAGKIEAVGKNAKQFQPGDEVFGDLSGSGWGGFAEYACAGENALALKPANITFEEAAAIPMAAITALQALRDKGKIQPGQKVLINGASGGVGTFAVQLAKTFGTEVTGVCSTKNLDIVRKLGADYAIDYTQENFTQNGKHYDLILAANGYHSIFKYKRSLNSKGIYVMSGGSGAQMLQAMFLGPLLTITGSNKMCNMMAQPSQSDLVFINKLLEAGKVRPFIDKTYTLSKVPEAFRYFENVHAQGKIVITM